MLGLFQSVKEALWPDNTSQGEDERPVKKETTTLSGRVTRYDKAKGSGMINRTVYFDSDVIVGGGKPQVGSEVNVHAERDHPLAGWRATKVIMISQWKSPVTTAVVNKVGYMLEEGRASCLVLCGEEELVFERGVVSEGCHPRRGDWVTLKVEEGEGAKGEVTAVEYLREKRMVGTVESVTGHLGMIEGDVGFTRYVCTSGYTPREGDTVTVHCVECKHNRMSWRALGVYPCRGGVANESSSPLDPPVSAAGSANPVVCSEEKCGVSVSGEGDYGEVEYGRPVKLVMVVSNKCSQSHHLVSCFPVSLKDQLKVTIRCNNEGLESRKQGAGLDVGVVKEAAAHVIQPGTSMEVQLDLNPTILGTMATAIVFEFKQFRMSRSVKARVIDQSMYTLQPAVPYTRNSGRHSSSYNHTYYYDKLKACSVPGQKPRRRQQVRLPHRLKLHPIPDEIRDCIDIEQDVTFFNPVLMEPLSLDTHQSVFSTLLYCEELQMETNIRNYDMFGVSLSPAHQYLSLSVPGLVEGRPSLMINDRVVLCEAGGDERSEHYEGFVHEVRGTDILLMFSETFHSRFRGDEVYDVMFTFNRIPLRRMHQAVEMASQIGSKVLFPTPPSPLPPLLRPQSPPTFFNTRLNARQRAAVTRILGAQGRPSPYVIFGPPGTGKTVTVVEGVLQVYAHSRGMDRILACAPSNSAADLIAERLLASGLLEKGDIVRVNALQRVQPPSPHLLPHCIDTDEIEVAARHKIVVCTCVTAGVFFSLGISVGHFTRVFIDEVGQATEPECLIPLGLLAGTEGQAVLAGDPYQLGPVLQSRMAQEHGLGMSLLERLMYRPSYQRDQDKFMDHGAYDPLLVTKLVVNYRSHKALLSLYSQIFYDNELIPEADHSLSHALCHWDRLPNPGFPLLFHGLMGEDMREGDSPSWFNPMEVIQVVRYTQLLLDGSLPLSVNDIGIISPYRKQVEKIRKFLKITGIEDVKVGSVEEFQGQERSAIILSTVRCNSDVIKTDLRHNLGFLSNPKRFNVSISRAQALLIIVGNPILLSQDKHWSQLLDYAVRNSAYTGAPLNNTQHLLPTNNEQ